ncbi:MAG: hypothetical protein NTY02_07560 [Acidobacteria bacterium]|nr:hypothetical protein [Acidobacteriota bacterium]
MRHRSLVFYLLCATFVSVLFAALAWAGPSNTQVFLYERETCTNDDPRESLTANMDSNFPDLTKYKYKNGPANWNDRISCIWVGSNASVKVNGDINYKGSSTVYGPGQHELPSTWNKTISSFKVRPNGYW